MGFGKQFPARVSGAALPKQQRPAQQFLVDQKPTCPGVHQRARMGHPDVMVLKLPIGIRVAAGLLGAAVDRLGKLPEELPAITVSLAGQAIRTSLLVRQEIAGLAARGDELLAGITGGAQEHPAWATFDEDETDDQSSGHASFDTATTPGDPLIGALFVAEQGVADFDNPDGDQSAAPGSELAANERRWETPAAVSDEPSSAPEERATSAGQAAANARTAAAVRGAAGQRAAGQRAAGQRAAAAQRGTAEPRPAAAARAAAGQRTATARRTTASASTPRRRAEDPDERAQDPGKAAMLDESALPTEFAIAEPISAESVPAEPVPAQSVSAESVSADSFLAEPISAESGSAEPFLAESIFAESIEAPTVPNALHELSVSELKDRLVALNVASVVELLRQEEVGPQRAAYLTLLTNRLTTLRHEAR